MNRYTLIMKWRNGSRTYQSFRTISAASSRLDQIRKSREDVNSMIVEEASHEKNNAH